MKVNVKYGDYIETIDEVKLMISKDQKQVLKVIEEIVDEVKKMKLQIETIDETISFSVTQELDDEEVRNYIKILQSLLRQMIDTQK